MEAAETAAARLYTATAAKDTSTSVREIRLEETRITINIRSPEIWDVGDTSDFRSLSFLLYMPLDMPNIDLRVSPLEFYDKVGSYEKIAKDIGGAYLREATFRTGVAFTLAYALTIVKGIYVWMTWLLRGPFDHLTVAWWREQERHLNWIWQKNRKYEVAEYFALRDIIIRKQEQDDVNEVNRTLDTSLSHAPSHKTK